MEDLADSKEPACVLISFVNLITCPFCYVGNKLHSVTLQCKEIVPSGNKQFNFKETSKNA